MAMGLSDRSLHSAALATRDEIESREMEPARP
jgi:hypothetical protein